MPMGASSDDLAPPEPHSAEEWGRRLRRGEPGAVEHVRQRVRRILSYRRLRIPNEDREDLEQEIMAELWRSVNRVDFDFTAGFWGFVEVLAARRCIDWLRSRRTTSRVEVESRDPAKSPLERVLDAERVSMAEQVLTRLAPGCSEVLELRLRDHLPYKRIAEIVGKSEGALRVQVHRCVRQAQQIIFEIQLADRRDGKQG